VTGVLLVNKVIFLLLLILPASAEQGLFKTDDPAGYFNIKPENPIKGDFVTVYGNAKPDEEITLILTITYSLILPSLSLFLSTKTKSTVNLLANF
jgi:hypothetical protein